MDSNAADWRVGLAAESIVKSSILPSFVLLLFQIHTIIHEVARSYLVIQLPRWVAVLCRPLQAYASLLLGFFCDSLNDLAPVAFASQLMINIQV